MRSHYGLLMRQLRMQAGYTPEQLAHEIGCSPLIVPKVEAGLMPIPGEYLILWANVVRQQPEELIYLYLMMQAEKMCADAGLNVVYKISATVGDSNDAKAHHRARHSGAHPSMARLE